MLVKIFRQTSSTYSLTYEFSFLSLVLIFYFPSGLYSLTPGNPGDIRFPFLDLFPRSDLCYFVLGPQSFSTLVPVNTSPTESLLSRSNLYTYRVVEKEFDRKKHRVLNRLLHTSKDLPWTPPGLNISDHYFTPSLINLQNNVPCMKDYHLPSLLLSPTYLQYKIPFPLSFLLRWTGITFYLRPFPSD